jgi:hypothetical protein
MAKKKAAVKKGSRKAADKESLAGIRSSQSSRFALNTQPYVVIGELEKFFKSEGAQVYISNRIDEHKKLHPILCKILHMMLQIDSKNRATSAQIVYYLDSQSVGNTSNHTIDTKLQHNNTVIKMEEPTLKKHIVDSPINNETVDNLVGNSWEYIEKSNSDSLIMKMSVDKGFLKWLVNNK